MNKYSGSNFDDFLEEEGILEEVSALAQKRVEKLENTSGLIGAFLQWLQFNNQLVLRAASVCVLIAIGVYLGNRYFDGSVSDINGVTHKNGVAPVQVEPTLVKGVSKEVKVSPSGFGAFPKIPEDFPDQDIWDLVEKRASDDPDGAKTLELLARVRIKLWEQGKRTKGVIMDPSSKLIYPDFGIKIMLSASTDVDSRGDQYPVSVDSNLRQPRQYDTYFDDGVIPQGPISVKFLGEGIDPYKFLNLSM